MAKVIIVVFDGLQPAQVTPELMPNLSRFTAEGVTGSNHHAVFPTVTRANVASIVTGHHPGAHGLTANTLVIPEFDPHRPINALEPVLSEVATQHPVLLTPTLGDILHRHGHEYIAVGAGTSGNAYLQNPNAETAGGATIHPDFCLPRSLHAELVSRFGPWPDRQGPSAPKMDHILRILTEYVLPERRPAVSMLWLSEPDVSQHAHGVGSPEAVQAIREADRHFGRLLAWLEERGLSSDTDVIIVSDHGYSTISEVIDIEDELRNAGFPTGDKPGGVAVAPNGGSALFYAPPDITERLPEWLTAQPWCGALVASEAAGGGHPPPHPAPPRRGPPPPPGGGPGGPPPRRGGPPRHAPSRPHRPRRPPRPKPVHVLPLGLHPQRRRIRGLRLLHQPRPRPRAARLHEPPRDPQRLLRPWPRLQAVNHRRHSHRQRGPRTHHPAPAEPARRRSDARTHPPRNPPGRP
ncbi:MAG: alkaline phosphatase family protein [Chloroflexi bacterium]|nr:alkaline phosphatase family protein [Chloroflexota bacterium]